MIRFQADQGAAVTFVGLAGSPLIERASGIQHVPIFPVESPVRPWTLLAAVARAVGHRAPDVVHVHGSQDFNALLPWIARERFLRRMPPLVLQMHIWVSHSKRDPLHALSYRWVDQLWCSSEPAKRSIERLLPIARSKIRILRYGRPMDLILKGMLSRSQARAELGVPDDAVVVGSVSRIDRGKGTAELIEGAVRTMRAEPRLHLVLIGGPTEAPAEIAFARRLSGDVQALPADLRSRVHLMGPLAASHRLLRAFDLFALPTYRECFSLALMEAQLAGLPCLATDAGGSPELVKEGLTGWLCAPESTDSFASALSRALADRARWPEFGARASARMRTEFDLEPALAETLAGYRSASELCARRVNYFN